MQVLKTACEHIGPPFVGQNFVQNCSVVFRTRSRNFYRLLQQPPVKALENALRSWRYRCPRCPQMPPDLRAQFVLRANEPAAIQWFQENSEPCPHGVSFDELCQLIELPVRRKLPKHVRAYLEEAINKGFVAAVMTDEGIRYVSNRRAP